MTEPGEKSPLFRPEALTAGDQAWRDRPPLDLGVPTLLTSIIAVALATALGALITLATYSSHIRMDGILLPSAGDIAISAPSSGRIEALAVREGEAIEKGAPLYTLNLDTADKDGGTPQQLMNRQTGKSEIFTHAKSAIDALKKKTFETDKKLTRSNPHHLLELRAPEDGVITAILAYPGQTVNAGWPMLRIAPQHGPLQAELLALSNVVVFIQEGRRVRLR